ncbi:hypothetical protein [Methylobacterium sp. R2-1]|uniref:hypothetical protein n=1 Tax=Methylobacterium sp. R2-1 TaxID=2587064 RepID=UPI001615ADFC|nr:hypothetical protein [Methylobacterium sp. R2-1]MBB2964664.1 hypothetical protein [Methylobacterium sp. R2-1]
MSLQCIMGTYRSFLNSAFPVLAEVFENDEHYAIDDWLQSNWEIIVEHYLSIITGKIIVLEVYGNGADCNGASSRVWMPNYTATHRIMCRIKSDGKILTFENFVGYDEHGRYGNVAPFTHAECEGDVLVPFEDCIFELESLTHRT